MKTGDKVPVQIAGQTVAYADVKEMQDNTATLVVPATLVVMATRTEITTESPKTEGAKVVIEGPNGTYIDSDGNASFPNLETTSEEPNLAPGEGVIEPSPIEKPVVVEEASKPVENNE